MESYEEVSYTRRLVSGIVDFSVAFFFVIVIEIVFRVLGLAPKSHELIPTLLLTEFGMLKTRLICFVLLYFLNWTYFVNGQTIGMKLLQYKVVMNDGSPVTMVSMVIRQLIFFLTIINPLKVVGGFLFLNQLLLSYTGKALHDWVVGTKVVYK